MRLQICRQTGECGKQFNFNGLARNFSWNSRERSYAYHACIYACSRITTCVLFTIIIMRIAPVKLVQFMFSRSLIIYTYICYSPIINWNTMQVIYLMTLLQITIVECVLLLLGRYSNMSCGIYIFLHRV